jgi:hypothetical protein
MQQPSHPSPAPSRPHARTVFDSSHPAGRQVICGDGRAWLREAKLGPEDAIVTSLPDVSELPQLGLDAWRDWFVETSQLACEAAHEDATVIFFQTDIKRDGRWVDKGYLVQKAAERSGLACLFHKIVCRAGPGTTTFGRPAYAHLLAFSKKARFEIARSIPDVLPSPGHMPWSRAMGVAACELTCRFLRDTTPARRVIDPFCGAGTMLAIANRFGLAALGVEISRRRAKKAAQLRLDVAEAATEGATREG